MEKQHDINELLDKVIEIWRSEGLDPHDRDTQFYNLQKDPLTRLLMGAVLHQTNLLEDDINSFKDDVLERYIDYGLPEYLVQPVPAMGLLQVGKSHKVGVDNQAYTKVDANTSFLISPAGLQSKNSFRFIPLLEISVYDVSIHSLVKIGKNRWHIEIEEKEALSSLGGLSFYVPKAVGCEQIRLFSNGRTLDVANVSEFEKMPFVEPLISRMRFSQSTVQSATLQNLYDGMCCCVNVYCVVKGDTSSMGFSRNNGCIELDMELAGVADDLELSEDDVLLNCVPIMNAEVHHTSLSQNDTYCSLDLKGRQFMAVISEIESDSVVVRTVGVERMSVSTWLQQMKSLIDYYDSEYNVIKSAMDDRLVEVVRQYLSEMQHSMDERAEPEGMVYLILKDKKIPSIDIQWLSTQGESANHIGLNSTVQAQTAEIDDKTTTLIMSPIGGRDAINNREKRHQLFKFYQQSRDKIVTKSDIVVFCKYKLASYFHLAKNDLVGISLRPDVINTSDGFFERVIVVDISVRKGAMDVQTVQFALERMIRSRTMGTSVIRVAIHEV